MNVFTAVMQGPAVDRIGRLFVTGYQQDGTIGVVNKDGTCVSFMQLPEKSTAACLQFNRQGNLLVFDAADRNILAVELQSKKVSFFCHNDGFTHPADMCINKKGQLFIADSGAGSQSGKIWRVEETGAAVVLIGSMGSIRSMCLSPNGKILYAAESEPHKIWAFAVDEKGNLSGQRLFTTGADYGFNGIECDYKGNVYACRPGKGAVAIFNPLGVQVQEVILKGKQPGNLAFGDTDYKTCFVTVTDRKGIEKFRTDVPGR